MNIFCLCKLDSYRNSPGGRPVESSFDVRWSATNRKGSGLLEVILSVGAAQVGGTIVDQPAATAAPDGRFAIPDITPGDYQIFSWRSIQPYAYFDPQFLLTFESQSQVIHLGELSVEHLELKVVH